MTRHRDPDGERTDDDEGRGGESEPGDHGRHAEAKAPEL